MQVLMAQMEMGAHQAVAAVVVGVVIARALTDALPGILFKTKS